MDKPEGVSEIVMYEAEGVKITNLRAVIGPKTYAMSNITSVSMNEKQNNSGCIGIVLALVGAYMAFAFLDGSPDYGLVAGGGLLAAFGIYTLVKSKPTYQLVLGSASGEQTALDAPDKARLQSIVDAINEAIINRG